MNECCHDEHRRLAGRGVPDTANLHRCLQRARALRAEAVHAAVRRLAALPQAIARALRERRNRRELLTLDEHQLHDIGLTHHDVERITGIDPRRQGDAPGANPGYRVRPIHFDR